MNTRILQNDQLQIEYLTDPLRIIGLIPAGKTNMLADLINLPPVPTPYGDFHFRGGHRLWHAPEAIPRTYIPDTPVIVTPLPDGVLLESQTEPGTGIRKQIEIHLSPNQSSLTLSHVLINDGMWTVELAPWAITQFRLGGTVILPMPVGNADPAGLLHNRQFSLWPYARFNDPRLKLGDECILFKADALLPPFKIGTFNSSGWLAYWLDGILFRKTFQVQKDSSYPDNNCNAEMYCNDQFVELESLAPLKRMDPNASVTHIETWDIFTNPDTFPDEIKKYLTAL
jgi:hypothetical protein